MEFFFFRKWNFKRQFTIGNCKKYQYLRINLTIYVQGFYGEKYKIILRKMLKSKKEGGLYHVHGLKDLILQKCQFPQINL